MIRVYPRIALNFDRLLGHHGSTPVGGPAKVSTKAESDKDGNCQSRLLKLNIEPDMFDPSVISLLVNMWSAHNNLQTS